MSHVAYLFYDEAKNSFYLKVHFPGIDANDTSNAWLRDLNDTVFYFKGQFPHESFPNPDNFTAKTFSINGHSYVNRVWHKQTVEITFFVSENNMLNPSAGSADHSGTGVNYERYKVNFGLSFLPSQYNMHHGKFHLQNPVYITLSSGKINLLKPGMEGVIDQTVYDHQ